MPPSTWKIRIIVEESHSVCLAESPTGQHSKVHIHHPQCLQAIIISGSGKGSVKLSQNWGVQKNIFRGYQFRIHGQGRGGYTLENFEPEKSRLFFKGEISAKLIGSRIDLTANEPLPLMAVRLLTQTCLEESLPAVEMQIERTASHAEVSLHPLILMVSQESSFRSDHIKVEVKDRIVKDGKILKMLTESEINKALRRVYNYPQAKVLIQLSSSEVNSLHEKSLANLLKTAGYKHVYMSHKPEQLFYMLPLLDTETAEETIAPIVRNYFQVLLREMGSGSMINLHL